MSNGAFLEQWQAPNVSLEQPVWHAGGTCKCFEQPRVGFWEHGFLELELRSNGTIEEQFYVESGISFSRMAGALGATCIPGDFTIYPAVADGVYVMLAPLSPGKHTIHSVAVVGPLAAPLAESDRTTEITVLPPE